MVSSVMNPYTCRLSTSSPPPSDVRNFTVINVTLLGPGRARVHAIWLPPLEENGILMDYTVCLSRIRLTRSVTPPSGTACESIAVSPVINCNVHAIVYMPRRKKI